MDEEIDRQIEMLGLRARRLAGAPFLQLLLYIDADIHIHIDRYRYIDRYKPRYRYIYRHRYIDIDRYIDGWMSLESPSLLHLI